MVLEFGTIVVHVVPPSIDLSILYPLIAAPPVSLGTVQLRLICEEETVVAARPVGAAGGTGRVVAVSGSEGEPVPAELIAETL